MELWNGQLQKDATLNNGKLKKTNPRSALSNSAKKFAPKFFQKIMQNFMNNMSNDLPNNFKGSENPFHNSKVPFSGRLSISSRFFSGSPNDGWEWRRGLSNTRFRRRWCGNECGNPSATAGRQKGTTTTDGQLSTLLTSSSPYVISGKRE